MRQARTRQSRAKRTSATAWFLIRAVAEWVGEAAVAAGLLAAPRLGEDFRAAPQTGRPLGLTRAGRRPGGRGWRGPVAPRGRTAPGPPGADTRAPRFPA